MVRQSALMCIQQVCGELGLPSPVTLNGSTDSNVTQLLALANAAGSELATYFNWPDLIKEWVFETVDGQDSYAMPTDWNYFTDQTQWDRTNHWPLLGPKSATEWQWLKGGMLSQGPRLRYRVWQGKFYLHPAPGSTPATIAMEYVSSAWLTSSDGVKSMITQDSDTPVFDFWLFTRFLKLKFQETKGLDTSAMLNDFGRLFSGMTGKAGGAPILNLSPRYNTILITPNNVPDGSWPVGTMAP